MVRVLVAADQSDAWVSEAQRMLDLLAPPCGVTVLFVIDAPPMISPPSSLPADPAASPAAEPEALERACTAQFAAAETALDRTISGWGYRADRLVVHGPRAAEICSTAKKGEFDLIVIGADPCGLLGRIFGASVSHAVVRHAPCPVIVASAPIPAAQPRR